jgi:predicted CoA-binding protein
MGKEARWRGPPAAGAGGPVGGGRMGHLNGEVTVTEAGQILRETGSILLVDWPSKDVPETLARAGYTVVVKGGPEPDNYSAYEVRDGEVASRRTGEAPAAVDLVYSYRPVEELPGIVAMAQRLGARAVWLQSGVASDGTKAPDGCWMDQAASQAARATVESAGLAYIEAPYIADEVRSRGSGE